MTGAGALTKKAMVFLAKAALIGAVRTVDVIIAKTRDIQTNSSVLFG